MSPPVGEFSMSECSTVPATATTFWHYLFHVKVVGPEKARAKLIGIAADRRVPMMTIHKLFAGKATPEDVLRDAGAGDPPAARRREQLFYAHLYVGLYYESAGDAKKTNAGATSSG